MLLGKRILIVEDESLIAMELADIVERAGGTVVGPVRTNRDALRLADDRPVSAALLDMNLADGDATPIARRLLDRGVPMVVCTAGLVPLGLRLAFPDLPVHRKPVDGPRLVRSLMEALDIVPCGNAGPIRARRSALAGPATASP
ncbi:response regulator [Methylobacterium sp. sgz302541]|uniref:response regulator n=1 Tax=unclassified Methylobacterium TaxID=2615210 RepID=UPI003D33FEE8